MIIQFTKIDLQTIPTRAGLSHTRAPSKKQTPPIKNNEKGYLEGASVTGWSSLSLSLTHTHTSRLLSTCTKLTRCFTDQHSAKRSDIPHKPVEVRISRLSRDEAPLLLLLAGREPRAHNINNSLARSGHEFQESKSPRCYLLAPSRVLALSSSLVPFFPLSLSLSLSLSSFSRKSGSLGSAVLPAVFLRSCRGSFGARTKLNSIYLLSLLRRRRREGGVI